MIELEFKNVSDASKYFKCNRRYFFDLLVEGVKKSYENNLLSLVISRVSILEEDITMEYYFYGMHIVYDSHLITIDIQMENWTKVLNFTLDYYIEVEEYEKCSYVKNLLNKIESLQK